LLKLAVAWSLPDKKKTALEDPGGHKSS